jgi:3-phosphoglycerate kinase
MEQLVNLLVTQGPYGVALAAAVVIAYKSHQGRVMSEQNRNEELKADKAQLAELVSKNTEAFTKVCGAVDNCTSAIERNTHALERLR